ncbi:GMP/IMP nucleotidase [Kangiella sediminilitoris]|uniref:HAD-superfamily hydrolase, subfamily IA, variant 3 n=1 Tax=Kangiella sediminilitoris TaxID=1144748 RepID=A0A1B3B898_9GAMM|nr:GMP/IMP nucleotidase [Kangiella sediminilitoris]AOE49029.1 HAD-superfamily hydrolase, subfamily IA, variant 3 [Kangiella sediminilitoris]
MARPNTLSRQDWENIDAILLDMDGTLLDLSFDNHFWQTAVPELYAEEKGISLEDSHQYLGECYDEFSGTLNWYCTDFWSEKLGIDIIQHKSGMAHHISLRPGTKEFLEKVSSLQKQIVLVTNAHPETLRVKLEKTSIDQYFDRLYSSHQFNQPKESAGFWQQLEQDLTIPLHRCLFIDDTENILMRAKQSGVKYVVMVEQPDMTRPARGSKHFPTLNRLTELLK